MQNPRPSRRLALCALALTFLLASCSQGGTTSSQTTQAHGKGSSSRASAASSTSKDPNIAFGQCMRAQGYDVPDTGLTPDQITDTSDAFNGAINKCMQEVSLWLEKKMTSPMMLQHVNCWLRGRSASEILAMTSKTPSPAKASVSKIFPLTLSTSAFPGVGSENPSLRLIASR